MTRWVEMHTWPAFEKPLLTVPLTTFWISASGITISGELEPSSMVTFLRPAVLVMCSPTSRLPVKVILRTRGSATSASPIWLPEPVTHCTASGGTPASSSTSVSLRAERGVSVAGLMMTELPAAMAGPTLWATRFRGKLKGLMATTTPHGTRMVKPNCPGPGRRAVQWDGLAVQTLGLFA